MLKQTVSYHDFDDNPTQETLYFNLTKTELADNLHLHDELEEMQRMFEGDARKLETSDIQKLINLVKTFMRLSYGVRSADGKRFIKSDEQWVEFTQTAVYDAFLYSLFEKPDTAVTFVLGILPKDLQSAANEAVQKHNAASDISTKLQAQKQERAQVEAPEASEPADIPAYQKERRVPNSTELLTMSQSEIETARSWMKENNIS